MPSVCPSLTSCLDEDTWLSINKNMCGWQSYININQLFPRTSLLSVKYEMLWDAFCSFFFLCQSSILPRGPDFQQENHFILAILSPSCCDKNQLDFSFASLLLLLFKVDCAAALQITSIHMNISDFHFMIWNWIFYYDYRDCRIGTCIADDGYLAGE